MSLAWPVIKDLLDLRKRLNRFFEEAYLIESPGVGEPSSGPFCPPTDLYETDDEVVIIVEIPGVEAESVEVKVTGETLRVAGRIIPSAGAEAGRYMRMERANGAFYRDFRLPLQLLSGDPTAELERGVLTVRLPKTSTRRRRRVSIIEEGS